MKINTTLIFLLVTAANAARILVVCPIPSYSHQIVYRPIWMELARKGHDVTVMTTDPVSNTNMTNLRQIDLSFSYKEWKLGMAKLVSEWTSNYIVAIVGLFDMVTTISDLQLKHPQVREIINNETEQFDLVMVEFLVPTHLPFAKRFNAPLIGMSSLDIRNEYHEIMGNPSHVLLYPDIFDTPDDSFWGRLKSVIMARMFYFLNYFADKRVDQVIEDNFGPGYVPMTELVKNFDMLFVNNNPLFSSVRPYTPATVSIHGGIHIAPLKELPEHIKTFMDNSENGIIYFSLGTNVKSKNMPNSTKNVFIKTFSELPYKVLWKFDDEELPGLPSNVEIRKWVPQQDILRHKNIKLFITQCGLQSLEESLYSHIPILCVPFFADQEANAQRVVEHGIGLSVKGSARISSKELKRKILQLIDDPKYKNKVRDLATRSQDEPMTPLERAMWWTEYVLRNKGAQHLKGPIMPSYKFYHMDILAFLVVGIYAILYIIYRMFAKIRWLCSKRYKNKND